MSFENSLGTIQCDTDLATINALLEPCGLGVRAATKPKQFNIVSGGRAVFPDPVVENELMTLAFIKLKEAQQNGRLPPFSFLAPNAPRA